MTTTTNGFLIRGEFTFPVYDVDLPAATHQQAMDYARGCIEAIGGQVVRREDSTIARLEAELADAHHTIARLEAELAERARLAALGEPVTFQGLTNWRGAV